MGASNQATILPLVPVQYWIDAEGTICNLAAYCKANGLNYHTVAFRVHKMGWSVEKALSDPVNAKNRIHEHNGEVGTLRYFSDRYDVKYNTLVSRMWNGMSLSTAIEYKRKKKGDVK